VTDLLGAWTAIRDACEDVYFRGDPVPDDEFDAFEARHGVWVLPDLRSVLRLARGGVELTDQGIALDGWPPKRPRDHFAPERPEEKSPELPEDLPPQLRVLGGNLGDDVWAVWLPARDTHATSTPVVVIREHDFDDLVVFDSVVPFLAVATATGLLYCDDDVGDALDALGVPERLRRREIPESELLDALAEWGTEGRERRYWGGKPGIAAARLAAALGAD
jgi:hypothetical protein